MPVSVTLEGANGPFGWFHLSQMIQRQDAVEDFSFVERTLIKLFVAEPMLYRHRGEYRILHQGKVWEGKGIVETAVVKE